MKLHEDIDDAVAWGAGGTSPERPFITFGDRGFAAGIRPDDQIGVFRSGSHSIDDIGDRGPSFSRTSTTKCFPHPLPCPGLGRWKSTGLWAARVFSPGPFHNSTFVFGGERSG